MTIKYDGEDDGFIGKRQRSAMTDTDKLIERLLKRAENPERFRNGPILKEAAEALQAAQKEIERLTDERDLWKSTSMDWAFDEAEAIHERDEALTRAEAAEARVKELETVLKHIANHSSMLDELENCMEMRRMAKTALAKAEAL